MESYFFCGHSFVSPQFPRPTPRPFQQTHTSPLPTDPHPAPSHRPTPFPQSHTLPTDPHPFPQTPPPPLTHHAIAQKRDVDTFVLESRHTEFYSIDNEAGGTHFHICLQKERCVSLEIKKKTHYWTRDHMYV